MAASSYFVELSDGSGHGVETIAHTENVILLDPDLRIRGVHTGTLGFDMRQLQADIETLRSEWSDQEPVSVVNSSATLSAAAHRGCHR